MIGSSSSKKQVIIFGIIIIATVIVFVDYFFIKPFSKLAEEREVTAEEKVDLNFLTEAYLNQNKDISIIGLLSKSATNQKYAVAADYYYLKNGKDHLNEYDKILEIAKLIFNDKKIEITNFVLNVDKDKCGKEKYSTIEGFINKENCDSKETIYEIISTYNQNSEYVVEFYASTAIQEEIEASMECESFSRPFSYKLRLVDFKEEEYYSKDESRCCSNDCSLEGISPFRVNLVSQVKTNNKIYKMTFDKIDDHFVFSKISEK